MRKILSPWHLERLNDVYFFYFRKWISRSFYVFGRLLFIAGIPVKGYQYLLLSLRLNFHAGGTRLLKEKITADHSPLEQLVSSGVSEQEAAQRSIILSLPSREGENLRKGVLLIAFTRTISYYLRNPDVLEKLDRDFVFVLEPSWSGYADPDILLFLLRTTDCFVQSTELTDRILLNCLFPEGKSLSFGASDWVDFNIFKPDASEKRYDSVYVANMNYIKRIYRYIDAVKDIVDTHDPAYKGCLVCAGWGGGKNTVSGYIEKLGIANNLEYIPGLPRERLVEKLNQCKVNVLLSLKEGSNRSLYEAMFVDIPVICLGDNIGVNKGYINEHTGTLVADAFFVDALVAMQSGYKHFSPRAWALDNISPRETTRKLARVIGSRLGDKCSLDLYVKVNRPELEYLDYQVVPEAVNSRLFAAIRRSTDGDTGVYAEIGEMLNSKAIPKNLKEQSPS